jgi:hypothetical protein
MWEAQAESLPREELERQALEGLRRTLRHVLANPAWRRRLAGAEPCDIRTIADWSRLPFLTKDELRDAYPFGLACVEPERVVRIHMSSGTTGNPVVNPYTRHPVLLAMETAALAGIAPGRVVLGLGSSNRRWIEAQMGIPFKAPLGGSTVSGVLNGGTNCYVKGNGVSKVAFSIDSTALNTDTTMGDGMQCVLDTTKFTNGTHSLKATGYDASGKTYLEVININIQNGATGPTGVTLLK